MIKKYQSTQERRQKAVRAKIRNKSVLPRLSVHRSLKFIYAQVINDAKGETVSFSRGKNPVEVGLDIAKKTIAAKIKNVVFDRGGYRYHGKVKKLAESARETGLKF